MAASLLVCVVGERGRGLDDDVLAGAAVLPRTGADIDATLRSHAAPHVVVLAERRDEALALRLGAAMTDRGRSVAVRVLPHGPAAVLVLALNAARLECDAGQVVGWLDAAAPRTWSGAWVPSVANLEDPAPSVAEHLRGYLPAGPGFVVGLAGHDGRAIVKASAVPAPAGREPRPHVFVTAATSDAVARALLGASGAANLAPLPFGADAAARRFGHRAAVEGVALPADPLTLVPHVRETCRVCGAAVATAYCSFCRVRPVSLGSLVPGGAL
ncbi:hypothetical protein ET495_09755 [Xylanimonas allomyrinae]|uniref:Uncharacterized protein n=1 Tax=Xylanimonas allomyrinae TaxID=2509459 RepID=A0A4P6EQ21_9MICO|nr:hypothetical protein [Xylanimonas allomyrinae]QAY63489.1 hypothetical protein ET495_09755 [Xylanimonas allomyrinae]